MDYAPSGTRVASGEAASASRQGRLSRVYRGIVHSLLVALCFLTPLFFIPFTVDPLEVNKQTLLVILVFMATLAWLGEMVSKHEVTVRRGWLNIFPAILLVCVLISSITSLAVFQSWVGESSQEYMSFLTTAAFVLFFYLLANNTSELVTQRRLFTALTFSALLSGLLMLFHALGATILSPLGVTSTSFNTIGTSNAAAIFLTVVTLLVNGLWLTGKRKGGSLQYQKGWQVAMTVASILLTFVTLILLAALDYWVLWVVVLVGVVILFVFAIMRAEEFPETGRFVMPMALFVVALLLLFLPSPLHLNLPVEVTPSYAASWSVATQTLSHNSPLFGSGPGTFVFDYTKYRSQDLNSTQFWSFRFDRAISHLLTVLSTLGIIGLLALILVIVSIAVRALNRLIIEHEQVEWKIAYILFVAWGALVVSFFLYSSDLTLQFLFWLLTGLLAGQVMTKKKAIAFNKSPRVGLAFSFLFVIAAVGIVTGLFITGQRYAAEVAFAQAVNNDQHGGSLDTTISDLSHATTFNRLSDIYQRNLAQALLLRVQQEIGANGSITADKATLVQQLIASSVNTAKAATDLSPNNVANWEIRGAIYREVSPLVGGADQAAVDAYHTSQELEPSSPAQLVSLGQSYIVFSENARALSTSKDADTAKKAQTAVTDNLKKAEDVLNQALTLKSDYAPAHYYLAIVYEREGRLDDAVTKMESVKQYNPLDVGVAFQLGVLYLQQGSNTKAQAEFERAVQLEPNYSDARWFLAALYEQTGQIDKAIVQVQEVLKLNPDNELVKAKLQRLESGQTSSAPPTPIDTGTGSATTVDDGQPTQ